MSACYRCGHPAAQHDATVWPTCLGTFHEPCGVWSEDCPCSAYMDPDADPSDADMPAWAQPGTTSPSGATRAAWRQSEEGHR